MKRAVIAVCMVACWAWAGSACAGGEDPTWAVEIGGMGEWGLEGGFPSSGPHAGLEHTLIEHWLEVELAATPLFSKGGTEIETELIFKKPFELAEHLEFLIGVGPEWIHRNSGDGPRDSTAIEATAGFDYELWPERHAGVFIEAAYARDFGAREDSIHLTSGVKVGIP